FFTGSLTGSAGDFTIKNVPDGQYQLSITFIGFAKKNIKVTVEPNNRKVNLKTIKIEVSIESLEEFEVVAEREQMMIAIDRKVFNVSEHPIVQGGNALDALRQVPTLVVDADGNISLRGSENVVIFINGRPSGITSDNLAL